MNDECFRCGQPEHDCLCENPDYDRGGHLHPDARRAKSELLRRAKDERDGLLRRDAKALARRMDRINRNLERLIEAVEDLGTRV